MKNLHRSKELDSIFDASEEEKCMCTLVWPDPTDLLTLTYLYIIHPTIYPLSCMRIICNIYIDDGAQIFNIRIPAA
jgi:hypothetical protein